MGTGFDINCSHTEAGIIPRAVQYLFTGIAQRRAEAAYNNLPVPEFKVVAQFLEVSFQLTVLLKYRGIVVYVIFVFLYVNMELLKFNFG